MVDRHSRNQLAEGIRALASGLITNDEFEQRVPVGSDDPAIRAVFSEGAWLLYSDLRQYRLSGKHRVPIQSKKEVARWVLFLKTDQPYQWPTLGGLQKLIFVVMAVPTFGVFTKLYRSSLAKCGDIDVWPFIRRSDFEEALKSPVYLNAAL